MALTPDQQAAASQRLKQVRERLLELANRINPTDVDEWAELCQEHDDLQRLIGDDDAIGPR